jgi:hypothetical protein
MRITGLFARLLWVIGPVVLVGCGNGSLSTSRGAGQGNADSRVVVDAVRTADSARRADGGVVADGQVSDTVGSEVDGGMLPAACALPAPIDQQLAWERTLYVSATATSPGDGTAGAPFDSIARAATAATPGTRVLVRAGSYGPMALGNLSGAPGRPVGIIADGAVTIDASGGVGIRMSQGSHVVIQGFTIHNAGIHGINIDDGGTLDSPAHHIVLRDITIAGAGSGGNNDCIKLSGIDDFWVLDSDISGCDHGEIIDMVGCHRGVIHGNHFHDTVGSGVQTKGGSADTIIHGNLFENIPSRAVNAGGSTDPNLTRPPGVNYEAARIRIISNVFVRNGVDGGATVAYVGCDACVFAHNTVIEPRRWVARILQESTGDRWVPSRNGLFVNNIIVLNTADLSTFVNIGPDTAPETFTFGSNLWYALDQGPSWAGPLYSGGLPPEADSLIQQDPLMLDRSRGNYALDDLSPAKEAARPLSFALPADFRGRCYTNPATLGAFAL